ncbi:MAG: phosphoribosylaminoimidazolesuccinocarboxamide synthase [Candidatus Nanopelagicales bacterium]
MAHNVEIPAPDYVLPDGYELLYSGKVRDLWSTPAGQVLFVASDRISAYDYVLSTPIPDKGKILTAVSVWWFERLADVVPNHMVSLDVPDEVAGRAMICKRLDMLPVECVARGYLTGSGLADYRRTGEVCGVELPLGLGDGARLPEPIFTPATKAAVGDHDENIDFDAVASAVGEVAANELRRLTLDVYTKAEGIARSRGLILADTKFEFGRAAAESDQLILADEVLTPDSSRWWPIEAYAPGRPQQSFDKQFVRDWLTSPESGWDKASGTQPPPLPEDVVERTRAKYIEAYERLTGQTWQ